VSAEGEELSGRPTQLTIPENVDAIHSMILNDQRISKKIAEILVISQKRIGYIIHDILDMRVPKCLNAIQKRDRVLASQAIWTDFVRIVLDF
jgi:hypothetical protein